MKIDDINEDYIKQHYRLSDHRKQLKRQINHNINGIYIELFPEEEMCVEIFVGRLNKYVDNIKTAYPDKEIEVNIKYDGWEYFNLDLVAYELYNESDKQVIKRLISNERSKLRRADNKKINKDKKREQELKQLRRLMKKYKGK